MAYSGNIAEIPLGHEGLVGSENLAMLRPGQLTEAYNVSYYTGALRKDPGMVKYNLSAIPSGSVFGGWDWWPTISAQYQVVVVSNGTEVSILRDAGTTTFPTALKLWSAGVNNPFSYVPVFVEGGKEVAANNKKLFIFTWGAPVQVLSGTDAFTTDLSAPPADWSGANQPIAGCIHENRLWGWGNLNDPHRVYASLSTNHEDFTTTPFSLSVFPGEGDRLVAGMSYRIGQSPVLLLWKYPRGMYMVDTSGATSAEWRPVRISGAVGAASPGCVVQVDSDVLYLDTTGQFQVLSGTGENVDLVSRNLSTTVDFHNVTENLIDRDRLFYAKGIYYPLRREAHFAMSSADAEVNDTRILIDFNRTDVVRFAISDRDVCQSFWLRKDVSSLSVAKLMSGDNEGFVWYMDQTSRFKQGVTYTSTFTPAPMFIAQELKTKKKNGQFLTVVATPRNLSTLLVEVIWDGRRPGQFVTFDLSSDAVVPGSVTAPTIVKKKKRITGSGTYLTLRCQAGDGDIDLTGMYLYYTVGSEIV